MSDSRATNGSVAKSRPIPTHPSVDLVLHEVFASTFTEVTNDLTCVVKIPCLTGTRLSAIMATAVRS
ncbi:hypothetical protein R1flu_009789 [Riccia fluitans]|uniref:Uncharacterized protein n=1 Tax=Riccia fluitans TaxID=41844 RepID=A0ABD1Z642_9MARC